MVRLFDRYEVFYNMLLATSVMTNTYSSDAVADAGRVIDFVGGAYGASDGYIDKAKEVILYDLTTISTVQDFTAFDAAKSFDGEYTDFDRYAEVKNEIIALLENMRRHTYLEACGWVDYTHYCVYQPQMRFRRLLEHSVTGDLLSTRMAGIFFALGIGCERDVAAAERKLLQCALWGDTVSARLLAYAESLKGGSNQSECFLEYAELMEIYLDDGITELPEEAKEKYSDAACTYYVYTSSIKYDVVYNLRSPMLDFSFLEIMLSKKLGYAEKMTYINEYDKKKWKLFTNDVSDKIKKKSIGF